MKPIQKIYQLLCVGVGHTVINHVVIKIPRWTYACLIEYDLHIRNIHVTNKIFLAVKYGSAEKDHFFLFILQKA